MVSLTFLVSFLRKLKITSKSQNMKNILFQHFSFKIEMKAILLVLGFCFTAILATSEVSQESIPDPRASLFDLLEEPNDEIEDPQEFQRFVKRPW